MGDSPRKVLADNLVRLMKESEDLRTIKQLHEACPSVSTGTIDRARRQVVSLSVDNVGALAAPFGLTAFQMLIPGIRAGDKAAPTQDAIQAARELLRYAAEIDKGPTLAHTSPAEPPKVAAKDAVTRSLRRGKPTHGRHADNRTPK